ncbi:MAG: GNAT family N-acetyltransferase [Vulcanimicrobiota bacterium]
MTEIINLTAEHAEEVERLAQSHYPAPYQMSLEEITENLEGLQSDDGNFCFGVVEEGKLVGYFMAWLDNSLVEGRAEDVVLVDDVVLSQKARRHLFALLKAMLEAMEEAGLGGLPIEGTVRKTAEETFANHPQAIERLGYQLVASHEYDDNSLGESLVWLRFEPYAEKEAVIDQTDMVELG